MSGKKIDLLDKNRFISQDKLQEERSPSSIKCAAHRGPSKKFNHPDIKRGASLAKQSRPLKKDLQAARHPDTLLEELAEIHKTAAKLGHKK
jgi:hypothetical protein